LLDNGFGRHIPEVTQSTVESPPLLGNKTLGTYCSNGQNTVLHQLLEVVASLRFAPSYKRDFFREFMDSFVRDDQCSAVQC
jgi:hypothetical protein